MLNIFADMAFPIVYYYGMSLYMLASMLFFDAVILFLFLKLIRKAILNRRVLIALIAIFIFGLISDLAAIYFAEPVYNGVTFNISSVFSLDNFYMINTYMHNYVFFDNNTMTNPVAAVTILITVALVVILVLNVLQKFILKINLKKTLLLAVMLAVLTNPIWGLTDQLFCVWLVMVAIVVGVIIVRNKKRIKFTSAS